MLLLLLGACVFGGMGAGLGQPTCKESNDYEWDWSPVRFVIAADDGGSFDLSTGWDDFPRITGSWGEQSLAYEEHPEPSDDHWIKSYDAVGTLEVMDGGDYRAEIERTLVDVHDEETNATVQDARTGCVDATRIVYDDEPQIDQTATFDADGYDTEGFVVWTDALRQFKERYGADGSYTEDSNYSDAETEETTHTEGSWTNGHDIKEYSGTTTDYAYDGSIESFLDGSVHQLVTAHQDDGYWWKYDRTLDYDGNGSGTFTSPKSDCALTYVEWDVTCDCVEGTGPCD